jgi:hypothetical protein
MISAAEAKVLTASAKLDADQLSREVSQLIRQAALKGAKSVEIPMEELKRYDKKVIDQFRERATSKEMGFAWITVIRVGGNSVRISWEGLDYNTIVEEKKNATKEEWEKMVEEYNKTCDPINRI